MTSLDLGCGSHCRADLGIDINFNSTPLEPLDKVLESYGFPYNSDADLIEYNLNDLPLNFEENTFDRVLLCHVLEHLDNPYLVLKEIKRILKENGFLAIMVPDSSINKADWRDEEHIYSWTQPSLEHLVSKLFKLDESKVIHEGDYDLLVICKKE